MVQESPRESLFKDRYFMSGRGIGSGSGIAKRFKDPALVIFWLYCKNKHLIPLFLLLSTLFLGALLNLTKLCIIVVLSLAYRGFVLVPSTDFKLEIT